MKIRAVSSSLAAARLPCDVKKEKRRFVAKATDSTLRRGRLAAWRGFITFLWFHSVGGGRPYIAAKFKYCCSSYLQATDAGKSQLEVIIR